MTSPDPTHPPAPSLSGEPAPAGRKKVLPYQSRLRSLLDLGGLTPSTFSAIRRSRRSPRFPRFVAFSITVAIFGALLLLRSQGWLEFLELKSYDLLVKAQQKNTSYANDIVFLGITEADIQKLHYPVPDAAMAKLLEIILSGDPSAVGLDIFRDQPVGEVGRPELIKRLKDPRVVSVIKYGQNDVFVGAPTELSDSPQQQGFADFPTDSDGRVRRAMLFFTPTGTTRQYRAMAVRLATKFLARQNKDLKLGRIDGKSDEWFKIGRTEYRALDRQFGGYVGIEAETDQIMFDFRGPLRFQPTPISAVLDGTFSPDRFKDKVVVIGMATESVKDFVSTSRVNDQFGPEVHAVLTEQLIRNGLTGQSPVRAWPDLAEYVMTFGWTAYGATVGYFVRQPVKFFLLMVGAGCVLLGTVCLAFSSGLWLPALPGLLGLVAAAGFVTQFMAHHERAERGILNDLFNRIVDSDVAETLWARRNELIDDGQLAARELRATLLFTDLEGFTTITEAMDKTCLMRFLNDYMTAMSDVIGSKPDAFVNKYIGDAVMAVFGPPLERDESQARKDAQNAIDCALEMRSKLATYREQWEKDCAEGIRLKRSSGSRTIDRPSASDLAEQPARLQRLRMRIGIQSGMVTAGSLGSRQRLEYTVIGDTVNTAARLESYDKELMDDDLAASGCRILIGQDTLDLLPTGEYLTREVGSIQLKGKEARVSIHGVLGRAKPAAGSSPPW